MKPFFSVILPTYNRELTVLRAVNSVLSQSFDDLELIIVDDGSIDSTHQLLQNSLTDRRTRYFKQENRGAGAARNFAIQRARGEFITFLDSDDHYYPDHLENMHEGILANPSFNVFFSQLDFIRENQVKFVKPTLEYSSDVNISEYILSMRGSVLHPALSVQTSLLKKVGCRPQVVYGDDQDLVLRLSQRSAKFKMLMYVGGCVDDRMDKSRLSFAVNPSTRTAWLNEMRGSMTDKAYFGDLGWTVAKAHADSGNYITAVSLYSKAVIKGCYSFKLAVAILLQVMLPKHWYHRASSLFLFVGLRP